MTPPNCLAPAGSVLIQSRTVGYGENCFRPNLEHHNEEEAQTAEQGPGSHSWVLVLQERFPCAPLGRDNSRLHPRSRLEASCLVLLGHDPFDARTRQRLESSRIAGDGKEMTGSLSAIERSGEKVFGPRLCASPAGSALPGLDLPSLARESDPSA